MSETTRRKKRSLLRISIEGLVRAPRRMKLALALNVVVLSTVAVGNIVEDLPELPTTYEFIALGLTIGGGLMLAFASSLWTLSQKSDCSGLLEFKRNAMRLRMRQLDETLIVFPVVALISGCMLAAGLTMFFVASSSVTVRWFVAAMGAWFFIGTSRLMAATSRFMHDHAREQAAAAERARNEATELQLATLQAQMNPHFLFNTLNTVASLVRTDRVGAEAMVENLAVVLRRTLDRSRRILSSVDEEIDHLEAYISVAKQRFGDRLAVDWAVDAQASAILVPTMTIQPLVENALKHGIGARLEGGVLRIDVHLEDCVRSAEDSGATVTSPFAGMPLLRLVVADDGPGFPRRYVEGTGLSNLRQRLATLYGEDASLSIDRPALGSRVVVTMPAVRAADEVLVELADARRAVGAAAD